MYIAKGQKILIENMQFNLRSQEDKIYLTIREDGIIDGTINIETSEIKIVRFC